jgi:hypothetical protein
MNSKHTCKVPSTKVPLLVEKIPLTHIAIDDSSSTTTPTNLTYEQ